MVGISVGVVALESRIQGRWNEARWKAVGAKSSPGRLLKPVVPCEPGDEFVGWSHSDSVELFDDHFPAEAGGEVAVDGCALCSDEVLEFVKELTKNSWRVGRDGWAELCFGIDKLLMHA